MKSHVTHTKSHVSSHIYEELQLVGSEYVTLLINMRHNSFKKHWFFCTLFLIINYFELFRKIFFFLDNCSCLSLKIAVEHVTWLIHTRHNSFRYVFLSDMPSSCMREAYLLFKCDMSLHICDMTFHICDMTLHMYVTWVTWLSTCVTWDMSSSYMWHDSDKSPSYVTWLMHISHSFICNMTHPFLAVCIRLFTCIHHMTRSSMRGGTSLIKIYDIFLLNKEYVPYKFFGNVFWI